MSCIIKAENIFVVRSFKSFFFKFTNTYLINIQLKFKYCKHIIIIFYSNLNMFKMLLIPVTSNLNFQHHYSSLRCHMILQKTTEYADLLLKKHL